MSWSCKSGLFCRTIRTVLSVWLDGYPDDLKEAPHFPSLHRLLEFVQCNMSDGDVVQRVKRRLDSFLRDDDSHTYISGESSVELVDSTRSSGTMTHMLTSLVSHR